VENPDDLADLSQLAWVSTRELRVVDSSRPRATERADVKAYREGLRAMELGRQGVAPAAAAKELGRPEAWVRTKMKLQHPKMLPKPKGMEWWDPAGFCEVTYLRGYASERKRRAATGQPMSLYEEIVSAVDWQQDRVWRVRKEENTNSWHLRTVKECPGNKGAGFCGRSLQKVPDSTHQIGPQDRRQAATTKPHADWVCELKGGGAGAELSASASCCQKPTRTCELPSEPYWWCPKCRWYACSACVKSLLPDKATSKQVAHWRPGECFRLDQLVWDLVQDFGLPDPRTGYTIKMNWYPDGLARVSPHRHDNWTLLVSLGAPRVLTVDRARVLMEDGDLVLFGTQSHGVPEMPKAEGGRLSLVLMFAPDQRVGQIAQARAATGGSAARRAGKPCPGLPAALPPTSGTEEQRQEGEEDEYEEVEDRAVSIAKLCSMGFEQHAVERALATCEDDVEQAAELLLIGGLD